MGYVLDAARWPGAAGRDARCVALPPSAGQMRAATSVGATHSSTLLHKTTKQHANPIVVARPLTASHSAGAKQKRRLVLAMSARSHAVGVAVVVLCAVVLRKS